ncbi:hypothetical protein ACHAXS_005991 [Conticribra weissflogii]
MPPGIIPQPCPNDGDRSFHNAKYKYVAVILFLGYFPITGLLFLKEGALLRSSADNHNSNNAKENRNVYLQQSAIEEPVEILKMTIKEGPQPITKIALLGERHSGTNWITNHLEECYSEEFEVTDRFTRFKHLFQDEHLSKIPKKSVIVVSIFRDPFDWVEAMRERPHHAHDHIGLDWNSFVTKPWVGHRGSNDAKLSESGEKERAVCLGNYSFEEIMPCSPEDSTEKDGYGDYKYELHHDRSGRPYGSIIDLRSAKITNHLSVADFSGTRAYLPFRYEDLNRNGTKVMLDLLREVTGIEPKCNAMKGTGIETHKSVVGHYVAWMNKYVDWKVEQRIGYYRR